MASQSEAELVKQDIDSRCIETRLYVHLRYEGSDTALAVAFGSTSNMTKDFEVAYQSRFGFLMPGKGLVAAMISVESIGRNFDVESNVTNLSNAPLEILDTVKCYMNDNSSMRPCMRVTGLQLVSSLWVQL